MCSAGSRLLIAHTKEEEFVDLLRHELSRWRPGDPFDPKTRMGSLIDAEQLARVTQYVRVGIEEAAALRRAASATRNGRVLLRADAVQRYRQPGRLGREEVLGPVSSLISFDKVKDAIAIANDSSYGLAAAVWTRDVATAFTTGRALKAGSVYVNCYDCVDFRVPFAAQKESGLGGDLGIAALEKYTWTKAL
jgi:4-guanidinobutyraldehyde dehydrogenase/NAD-dependent aldehyde dehydrogenase